MLEAIDYDWHRQFLISFPASKTEYFKNFGINAYSGWCLPIPPVHTSHGSTQGSKLRFCLAGDSPPNLSRSWHRRRPPQQCRRTSSSWCPKGKKQACRRLHVPGRSLMLLEPTLDSGNVPKIAPILVLSQRRLWDRNGNVLRPLWAWGTRDPHRGTFSLNEISSPDSVCLLFRSLAAKGGVFSFLPIALLPY